MRTIEGAVVALLVQSVGKPNMVTGAAPRLRPTTNYLYTLRHLVDPCIAQVDHLQPR